MALGGEPPPGCDVAADLECTSRILTTYIAIHNGE